jgi:hypothetical protein
LILEEAGHEKDSDVIFDAVSVSVERYAGIFWRFRPLW